MDIQKIHQYKSAFDLIAKSIKDDEGNAIEVWYARELQQVLGYARWENFVVAIGRAMESCKTLGVNVDDHFREVTKMIALAKGAQREVQDFMLTRYACYLIAQNGDPKKEEVAFAQSYFAVQTRKAELIEERLNEVARLNTRERLRTSEKQYKHFKGLKKENLRDKGGTARLRVSRGGHLTNLEIAFNILAEASATELSKQRDPRGFHQQAQVAKDGGSVAKAARNQLESQLGIVSFRLPRPTTICCRKSRKMIWTNGLFSKTVTFKSTGFAKSERKN